MYMDLPPLRIQMPPNNLNLPHDPERPETPETPRPVRSLIKINISPEQFAKYNNSHCSICTEPYTNREIALLIPCNHGFHLDCVLSWTNLGYDSCPLCRKNISSKQPVKIEQQPNNPFTRDIILVGGGMNYFEKYQKYKNKYLQLKNIK